MARFSHPVRTRCPIGNDLRFDYVADAHGWLLSVPEELRHEWRTLDWLLARARQTSSENDVEVARLVLVEALRSKGWLQGVDG
jgi:hypothetical protein